MKKTILTILVLVVLSPAVSLAAADWSCVANATDTREDAVISAVEEYHTELINLLNARKTALSDANSETEKTQRQTLRKTAWNEFKSGKRAALSEFKSAKKTAWNTFRNTLRNTCKQAQIMTEEKETSSTEIN